MTELTMASKRGRSLTCGHCGRYLSREEVETFHTFLSTECRGCKRSLYEKHINPHILKSSHRYLDPDVVLQSNWWHSTRKENWHDVVPGDVTVHVGTHHAARQRAKHTGAPAIRNSPVFLYKLRLKPNVKVNKSVYRDTSDNSRNAGKNRVTRYVNIYESPGSMSLIARRDDLEVVSFERLDR